MRYVTPNGSPTSNGITEPCNLWRAIQLVNNQVRDTFQCAPGTYSQDRLTLSGSGGVFHFEPGAELVGAQTHITDPFDHFEGGVYSIPYSGGVGTVVQRGNWIPIFVNDNYARSFYLTEPVKLKWVSTIARVVAQYGTWTHSAGRVYVHLYHGGAPTPEDELYFAPENWGSLVITGDDNVIEGLTIRNTRSTGLWVQLKAANTVLSNIKAVDAQVWLEGQFTIAERLDISHVITQGSPDHRECLNSNDGTGECWNADGDGRGLLIGRQNTSHSYRQTITDSFVHRCWNGARIDGPNTLQRSRFWGFPNHTLEGSGNNVTIQNCVCLNGQDSLFVRGAFEGWNVTNNIFINACYLTRSKTGVGGTPATLPWFFTRNIVSALTMDWLAYDVLQSDMNVWLERGGDSNMYRVIDTNGVRGFTLDTFAEILARTPGDNLSKAMHPDVLKGGMFVRYTGPEDPNFNFNDALVIDGERVGPEHIE